MKTFENEAKRQLETGEQNYIITGFIVRNLHAMLPELVKKENDIGVTCNKY
jgi:hypothetical protein